MLYVWIEHIQTIDKQIAITSVFGESKSEIIELKI